MPLGCGAEPIERASPCVMDAVHLLLSNDDFRRRSNLPGSTTHLNDTARLSRSGLVKLSAFEQRAAPFAHALEGDVKRRDHEDPNGARSDHAGENRCTDVVPTDLRGALSNHQRIDAENERKRG